MVLFNRLGAFSIQARRALGLVWETSRPLFLGLLLATIVASNSPKNSGREVSHTSPSALRAWIENAPNRLNSTMNGMDSLRGVKSGRMAECDRCLRITAAFAARSKVQARLHYAQIMTGRDTRTTSIHARGPCFGYRTDHS